MKTEEAEPKKEAGISEPKLEPVSQSKEEIHNDTEEIVKPESKMSSQQARADDKAKGDMNYLKGTLNSINRQNMNDEANERAVEGVINEVPAPYVVIPAQITKSQEAYIAKRQNMLQKQRTMEKSILDKHLPPVGSKPHQNIQSRYMAQPAQPPKKEDPPKQQSYPTPSKIASPSKKEVQQKKETVQARPAIEKPPSPKVNEEGHANSTSQPNISIGASQPKPNQESSQKLKYPIPQSYLRKQNKEAPKKIEDGHKRDSEELSTRSSKRLKMMQAEMQNGTLHQQSQQS